MKPIEVADVLAKGWPIVDIRDDTAFKSGHIQGSANIPWPQYFDRLFELPDPAAPFVICLEPQQLEPVVAVLKEKRHQPQALVVWQADIGLRFPTAIATGSSCVTLWQANPLLTEFADRFETRMSGRNYLDLACGAGREIVYMARRGWQAQGIDYIASSQQRAQQLAQGAQVSIDYVIDDIEADSFELPSQPDLVSVFRFLYRPLLPKLAHWMQPGGVVIYQTFMQGCERFGSPKNPNFLLKPGELAQVFDSWDIWLNRVDHLPDGRPVNSFIAQKQ